MAESHWWDTWQKSQTVLRDQLCKRALYCHTVNQATWRLASHVNPQNAVTMAEWRLVLPWSVGTEDVAFPGMIHCWGLIFIFMFLARMPHVLQKCIIIALIHYGWMQNNTLLLRLFFFKKKTQNLLFVLHTWCHIVSLCAQGWYHRYVVSPYFARTCPNQLFTCLYMVLFCLWAAD